MLADIYGLILTGGESSRMGRDKASISYGKSPQWQSAHELLLPFCKKVYWSCTEKQKNDWGIGSRGLVDKLLGHGPAGGLHRAFTLLPDVAWLVMGCDYPLLETEDIGCLVSSREEGFSAISFFNEHKQEIEPMITLWEPEAQQRFLKAFSLGEDSPRRILKTTKIKTLIPRSPEILTNRNQEQKFL